MGEGVGRHANGEQESTLKASSIGGLITARDPFVRLPIPCTMRAARGSIDEVTLQGQWQISCLLHHNLIARALWSRKQVHSLTC